MRASGIYKISLADGRCYVGQSCDMHRRWNEHRSRLRRGLHWLPYLQNAWNKYGEDAFTFSVLEKCGLDALTRREQWWLDAARPAFNVAPVAGSLRGYKRPKRTLTPEHRAKISASHRGKTISAAHRASISAALMGNVSANRGRPLSDEAKARLSTTQKARLARLREEGKMPVRAPVTHCKRGHEFTSENTRTDGRGWRACRTCLREKRRKSNRPTAEHHH